MEENKNCCEKISNCCPLGRCCAWKKCTILKYLLLILVLLITFCLGSQFGELKSQVKGNHYYRGEMMDWNYKVIKPFVNTQIPKTPETATTELQ